MGWIDEIHKFYRTETNAEPKYISPVPEKPQKRVMYVL